MHTLSRRLIPAALALGGLTVLAAAPAHAQNLVQDGGFEQADGANGPNNSASPFDAFWTIPQGDVDFYYSDPAFVYDGTNSLLLTPDFSGTTTLSQNIATQAGGSYSLSFYADQFGGGNNLLNVSFGNAVVSGGPIAVPADAGDGFTYTTYTFYSYTVQAAAASTALTFSSGNDDSNLLTLDDISVTPNAPAAVPEASTTVSFGLLLMLGLGGAALRARRKAQSQAG